MGTRSSFSLMFRTTKIVWKGTKCAPETATTFTGKELDEETGYGYFGARYIDHKLMTMWLSVDPMTDKYPSMSPYNYCAWNPVKLVDPDGEEVYLKGEKGCVDKALSMMNSASKHLTFFIGADGRVSCTGKARNRRERMMINIINSQDVTVNMEVQDHDRIPGSDDIINEGGGAYMGNTLNADKSHANTRQLVNVDKLEFYDKATNKNGNLIWHEIGESFIGGCNAIKSGVASGNGLTSPKEYQAAHKKIGRLFPGTIVRQQCTKTLSEWVKDASGNMELVNHDVVVPNCYIYSIKK